ncbi:MAG: TMEM14 family protein [Cyanobacteria bacterium SZAS LIN-5]|nr:TMEM14 family protein [Cyanobacteria bacterium SZAS LIN-5]RTL46241.1 MAG: hypothetical protein EKK48_00980 [Candidatus Melainabacteria bacterium]
MAIIVAAGGVMGFVKAQSKASLIAGVISGVILGVIFALSGDHPKEAIIGAFVTYSLLDTVFAMRLKKTRKFMPAGLILIFCFIGQVISAVAFVNTPV